MGRHHVGRDNVHLAWDNALAPVLVVGPGDVVDVDVDDASGGQLQRTSTAADVPALDFAAVNPCTGPIAVDGAKPGDDLVVEVLEVDVAEWGWTANIPGFGLLADAFPEPHLRISRIADGKVELLPGMSLPLVPMIGTIGVAPLAPGQTPLLVPTERGGNMDIRQLGPGAELRLPVAVPGALLSLGDTHAAQGDAEVCGTGIETSARVRLRIGLEKGRDRRTPMLVTVGLSNRAGRALATTGVGPSLLEAARVATSQLIDEVVRRTGMAALDAYLLASVAADMKVSEIVDLPNYVVSLHLDASLVGLAAGRE